MAFGLALALDLNAAHKLEGLVDSACERESTFSTSFTEIKKLLRKGGDPLIRRAFELLVEKMSSRENDDDDDDGVGVGVSGALALEGMHVLFLRSKTFRDISVSRLQEILELAVSTCAPESLSRLCDILSEWTGRFGNSYKQLQTAERYVRSKLVAQAQERSGVSRTERAQLHESFLDIVKAFPDFKSDFASIVGETQTFLGLLEQSLQSQAERERRDSEYGACDDEDDDGSVYVEDCEGISSYAAVEEEEEEEALEEAENISLDTFRDLLNQLHRNFVTKLRLWHDVLMRYDPSWADMRRSHHSLLEETVRMRAKVQDIEGQSRSIWSRCTSDSFPSFSKRAPPQEQDQVEFEDAPFHHLDAGDSKAAEGKPCKALDGCGEGCSKSAAAETKTVPARSVVKDPTLRPAGRRGREGEGRTFAKPLVKKVSKLAAEKKEALLRQAPVVEEPDKIHVSDGCDVFANARGLEIEGHWGSVDDSAVVPTEKLAILNQRVSFYEPSTSEISICGARLANGGLCQRRDKKICPFHGPIVPRDSEGRAVGGKSTRSGGGASASSKTQRELDKEANLKILQELAGGKTYDLPPVERKMGNSNIGKKKSKRKGKGEPVSHRKRIQDKLFNPKKNKLMKTLLADLDDIAVRNRNVNKW